MRTALYLRVSTSHQKPDLQADGLRHYATRAGLDIIVSNWEGQNPIGAYLSM